MARTARTRQIGRRRAMAGIALGVAAPALAWSRGAASQAADPWPSRRVRMITPAAPGSSLELTARIVAERLAARWGQPVVIEGRPGGDGIPALEAMLAAPAGEALLMANHGVVTVTPILHPRLGFDPMTALTPVVDLAADQFGVAVPAALPAQDLGGLVALARERPGALNWTSAPGPPYLAMRAFLRDAGLDMVHVGFRGVGAATVAEMLADRLQVVLAPLAPVAALTREGKLRVIAVTGAARAPALPSVPTSAQQGFPGVRQEGIHGLFGWRGLPAPLLARLAAEAAAIVAEPALAARLASSGLVVRPGGTPAGFAALLAEQRAHWSALAREFGATPPA